MNDLTHGPNCKCGRCLRTIPHPSYQTLAYDIAVDTVEFDGEKWMVNYVGKYIPNQYRNSMKPGDSDFTGRITVDQWNLNAAGWHYGGKHYTTENLLERAKRRRTA